MEKFVKNQRTAFVLLRVILFLVYGLLVGVVLTFGVFTENAALTFVTIFIALVLVIPAAKLLAWLDQERMLSGNLEQVGWFIFGVIGLFLPLIVIVARTLS